MQDEHAGGVDAGVHVGEHIGDRLMLMNLLAELSAVFGVRNGGIKGGAGNTECLRGDTDASAFQIGKRNGEAFAARAEQLGLIDFAVIQNNRAGVRGADAELMLGSLHIEAGCVGGHDKSGQTFFAQVRVGHRKHNGQLRPLAVGNELLIAVQYPLAMAKFGRGFKIIGFRACLRFGQTKAADFFSAG